MEAAYGRNVRASEFGGPSVVMEDVEVVALVADAKRSPSPKVLVFSCPLTSSHT